MSTRVVDVVDDWDEQSFTGGYRTLHELADEEFSGVCRAGGAELYMTSGTVVGVLRGGIEDFQDGEGTIYEAPSPALPLLAVMQERSDEVRAQYYTEDTPLEEVDRTLSDGGFSGYVELAENVLSGDYYLVYYAGRSMSVAFVGASGRLIDGDEAFETANDEVGIYEVRPVDIEPIEIPEPEPEPESGSASTAGSATGAVAETAADADDGAEPEAESEREPEAQTDADTDDGPGTTGGESRPEPESGSATDDDPAASTTTAGARASESADETSSSPDAGTGTETSTGAEAGTDTRVETGGSAGTASGGGRPGGETRQGRPKQPEPSTQNGPGTATQGTDTADAASATDLPLETRAIPSLDPDRTTAATGAEDTPRTDTGDRAPDAGTEGGTAAQTGQSRQSSATERDSRAETTAESQGNSAAGQPDGSEPAAGGGAGGERIDELRSELDERESEIERLEAELERAQEEQETLESELESVRDERDELAAEVERLESQLEQLEAEFGAATEAERRLTPAEALDGTDIFVRYGSKGKATLEKAHDGGPRKEKVNENLRLEKHTQFDASTAAVGGQSYDAFLEETMEFQFVRWLIRELLFEIRDTGHTDGLKDLYDALPKVDRAELSGVVAVTYTEDGQETRSQESFDIVLRDRMGNPLLVANLNDSREAATQSMMEGLITAAERVGQSKDTFAGAFLVTRSFFEPEALETASEATKGGLFSRDKRESFVNLSRKRGYHLCLVEARKQQFNLAVPDL